MIALVEGASRQKTPNEIALNILLAEPDDRVPRGHRDPAAVRRVLRRRAVRGRAGRAAGLPDPDHDRRAALGHRHRRHGPAGPAQRAGDVRTGRRGGRRREHAAARQDRHDHARQPAGGRVHPRRRRAPPTSSPTPRSCPASPTRRRRAGRSSCSPSASTACASGLAGELGQQFVPFTAQTRMSRRRPAGGRQIRKGAAVRGDEVGARQRRAPHRRGRRRSWTPSPPAAAPRWSSPSRVDGSGPGPRRRSTSRTSSRRACASASTRCGGWASAP